jgi:hypothetical protein
MEFLASAKQEAPAGSAGPSSGGNSSTLLLGPIDPAEGAGNSNWPARTIVKKPRAKIAQNARAPVLIQVAPIAAKSADYRASDCRFLSVEEPGS